MHCLQHVHVEAGSIAQGGFGVDLLFFQGKPYPGQQFGVFQHEYLRLEDSRSVAAQVLFRLKSHLRQLGAGGLHGVLESLPFHAGVLHLATVKSEVGPAELEGRADGDAAGGGHAAQGLAGGAIVGQGVHCHHLRGGENPPAFIRAGGVLCRTRHGFQILFQMGRRGSLMNSEGVSTMRFVLLRKWRAFQVTKNSTLGTRSARFKIRASRKAIRWFCILANGRLYISSRKNACAVWVSVAGHIIVNP